MNRNEAVTLLMRGPAEISQWNKLRERELNGKRGPFDLPDTDVRAHDLSGTDFAGANLVGVDFSVFNLRTCDFSGADLSGAKLIAADLGHADYAGANLEGADLFGVQFGDVILDGANLSHANLRNTAFFGDSLTNAIFTRAQCGATLFLNVDLSETVGLASVGHDMPSTIGTDTLYRSKGRIPEAFLRGCGVPESVITHLPSLIGSAAPIEFYTCFISYSTVDEEFATRLHNDFQAAGVRCWRWEVDARTGRSLMGEIDEAIRKYDKLVLIASRSSLASPAVNREIERAIQKEDAKLKLKNAGQPAVDPDVLFPVRIDDYILHGWQHERKVDVVKKVIADARGWEKDHAKYEAVLKRLVRDLKHE